MSEILSKCIFAIVGSEAPLPVAGHTEENIEKFIHYLLGSLENNFLLFGPKTEIHAAQWLSEPRFERYVCEDWSELESKGNGGSIEEEFEKINDPDSYGAILVLLPEDFNEGKSLDVETAETLYFATSMPADSPVFIISKSKITTDDHAVVTCASESFSVKEYDKTDTVLYSGAPIADMSSTERIDYVLGRLYDAFMASGETASLLVEYKELTGKDKPGFM